MTSAARGAFTGVCFCTKLFWPPMRSPPAMPLLAHLHCFAQNAIHTRHGLSRTCSSVRDPAMTQRDTNLQHAGTFTVVAVPLLVGLSGRKVSWTTWAAAGALPALCCQSSSQSSSRSWRLFVCKLITRGPSSTWAWSTFWSTFSLIHQPIVWFSSCSDGADWCRHADIERRRPDMGGRTVHP